jgi:hypothetical protein
MNKTIKMNGNKSNQVFGVKSFFDVLESVKFSGGL